MGRASLGNGRRKFSPIVVTVLAASLVITAGPSPAQDSADLEAPYVVLLRGDPVVAYDGGVAGMAPTRPASGERFDRSAPAVVEYAGHLEALHDRTLAAAGVPTSQKRTSFTFSVNGFAATLTPAEAARLSKQPEVRAVVPDEMAQIQTDVSPSLLELTLPGGFHDSGIDGEGVIVGVIDTGIWPEHPSFADDGSYPAPPAEWMGGSLICEFGDTAYNPDDAPFDCQNKLIGARDMRITYKAEVGPELFNSARDFDGHGTHTSSTAAGNAGVQAEIFDIERGVVSGIAPRAQVAV